MITVSVYCNSACYVRNRAIDQKMDIGQFKRRFNVRRICKHFDLLMVLRGIYLSGGYCFGHYV